MITAIIFDMDDTLYNYSFANEKALEILFEKISQRNHIPIDTVKTFYQKITQDIKRSNNPSNKFNKFVYMKQLCQRLDIPLCEIGTYLEIYHSHFHSYCHLYEGVMDLFKYLKNQNIYIAILSNNQGKQQYDKLNKLGILEWIDVMITSDECGEEKPHENMSGTISGFLKEKGHHQIAMVGDNFSHDIEWFLGKDVACFQFIPFSSLYWKDNYCVFGSFIDLQNFFTNYYKSIKEYVFLSKYFGQSMLNVQGCGGNISVKTDDDIMMIKSSGTILADTSESKYYCVVQNKHMSGRKIWGDGHPSMEIFFHSFMKKYTVHIHFTLSNIFLCSSTMEKGPLKDFELGHSIIEYTSPGILLGKKIFEIYNKTIDIYFLKNHGLIMTGDTIEYVLDTYRYIFTYFNHRLDHRFSRELMCFDLHRYLYNMNHDLFIIRYIDFPIPLLQNIIYCFPDLALFLQEITCIDRLDELPPHKTYQVIIFQSSVYLCGKDLISVIFLEELLQTYRILQEHSVDLSPITDIDELRNMKEEKIRLKKHF